MRHWLAIDIGGTKVAAAVVTDDGRVLGEYREPTQGTGNAEMATQLRHMLAQTCTNAAILTSNLAGVGVDVPGSVDRGTGTAIGAVNLGFHHLPIAAALKEATPAPIVVENDTNAGALGEKWFGAGRDSNDFAYIAVGTGVGGGLVLGGHLYLGAQGGAGEIGHCIVDPNGLRCRCGTIGCLEAMTSGVGIPHLAEKLLGASGARRLGGGELPAPHQVYKAAKAGDAAALKVAQEVGRLLAVAVVNLFRLLDIEKVIVAGGVATAGEPFLKAIHAGIAELGYRVPPGSVVLSPLGSSGTLLGAAAVVREQVDGRA